MKRNILKLACLAVAVLLAACSSEDMVGEGKKVDVSKGITFQFSEERFLPGTFSSTTRAAMQPQVVDLGNGMEAEMTLEPDSSCMGNTRAGDTPISDGHYMIYAIKTEDGQRYDGLKGEVKNGKFIPDTPTPWYLEPGKEYTFVCWKDKEEYNGTYYPSIVDNGTEIQVYAGCNAMIGTTVHTVTYDDEDVVPFQMKHLDARVRVQFNTYTAPMKNAEISGLSGDGTDNADRNFDLKGNLTYANISGPPQINGAFDITPAYTPSAQTIVYKHLSKNSLYYPDNSHIAILYFPINFTSTSTLYGKSLSDFTNTNPQSTGSAGGQNLYSTLQKNHSYTWKINIRPSVLYLFSDGTVGTLGDADGRHPIGIVVKENTSESDKGTACALDILNYHWKNVGDHIEENVSPSPTNLAEAAADMNGENWTYNANLQGTVRSNQATTYPAFYQAARYTPGVATASNIGRWYLPSYGELIKFVQVFQKGFTPTATEPVSPHIDQMNTGFLSKVQNAFTQASKPDMSSHFIISSTQVYGGTPSLGVRPVFINIGSVNQLYTGFCWNTMGNSYIMPFVHF